MRIHRQKAEFHDRWHIAHPGRPERASRRSARHRTRSMRYLQALPTEASGCLTAMRLEGRDVGCGRMSPAMLMRRWSSTVDEDAMIAATALVHRLTVVTRNVRDFSRFGVPVLNPFE